jgi:hypothetical protein
VLGNDSGISSLASHTFEQPVLDRACVEHGLCRREGLGDDEDQCRLGVEPVQGTGGVHRVNIGQKPQTAAISGGTGLGLHPQSLIHKLHAQVATADADGDDVFQWFARRTHVLARSDGVRESSNAVEDAMYLR